MLEVEKSTANFTSSNWFFNDIGVFILVVYKKYAASVDYIRWLIIFISAIILNLERHESIEINQLINLYQRKIPSSI